MPRAYPAPHGRCPVQRAGAQASGAAVTARAGWEGSGWPRGRSARRCTWASALRAARSRRPRAYAASLRSEIESSSQPSRQPRRGAGRSAWWSSRPPACSRVDSPATWEQRSPVGSSPASPRRHRVDHADIRRNQWLLTLPVGPCRIGPLRLLSRGSDRDHDGHRRELRVDGSPQEVEAVIIAAARGSIMQFAWLTERGQRPSRSPSTRRIWWRCAAGSGARGRTRADGPRTPQAGRPRRRRCARARRGARGPRVRRTRGGGRAPRGARHGRRAP